MKKKVQRSLTANLQTRHTDTLSEKTKKKRFPGGQHGDTPSALSQRHVRQPTRHPLRVRGIRCRELCREEALLCRHDDEVQVERQQHPRDEDVSVVQQHGHGERHAAQGHVHGVPAEGVRPRGGNAADGSEVELRAHLCEVLVAERFELDVGGEHGEEDCHAGRKLREPSRHPRLAAESPAKQVAGHHRAHGDKGREDGDVAAEADGEERARVGRGRRREARPQAAC